MANPSTLPAVEDDEHQDHRADRQRHNGDEHQEHADEQARQLPDTPRRVRVYKLKESWESYR